MPACLRPKRCVRVACCQNWLALSLTISKTRTGRQTRGFLAQLGSEVRAHRDLSPRPLRLTGSLPLPCSPARVSKRPGGRCRWASPPRPTFPHRRASAAHRTVRGHLGPSDERMARFPYPLGFVFIFLGRTCPCPARPGHVTPRHTLGGGCCRPS